MTSNFLNRWEDTLLQERKPQPKFRFKPRLMLELEFPFQDRGLEPKESFIGGQSPGKVYAGHHRDGGLPEESI